MIVEVPSDRRKELLLLFDDHPYLHALSEAFLKEGVGQAYTDNPEDPQVVLLLHKGVIFISGDANNNSTDAIFDKIPEKWLIIPPPGRWVEKLKERWGDALKPYPRTKFSSKGLDIGKMQEIQRNLPKEMTIEAVTEESIKEISPQATGLILMIFPSVEKFMEKNFGFMIREGETVVSLALAASPLYTNDFEIHIETHPDYQKRGLAMISAARLIQYSLENGMVPHWDADNPPSAKLATKLGFTNPEEYNAYYWFAEPKEE
ncbi:MAG: GNAT family N-acetyltransferase [Candidatus Thorarchaeota archaeon]|jgi:GNAT superfamily N-acetyltransferase